MAVIPEQEWRGGRPVGLASGLLRNKPRWGRQRERCAPLLTHWETGEKQQEVMFPTCGKESSSRAFCQRQVFTAGFRKSEKPCFRFSS